MSRGTWMALHAHADIVLSSAEPVLFLVPAENRNVKVESYEGRENTLTYQEEATREIESEMR